ncbi:hypothetical protein PoMZ_01542 [Pyricularia oryzae]|uniref:Uncharacterized protein n=1 Tax=Pyricularia oryzae TaxID=318829 RepID=A0A4P7N4Y9_PYROR|nr:hypothetical protein PoMZ_01542 [Pyricularia oryzae]
MDHGRKRGWRLHVLRHLWRRCRRPESKRVFALVRTIVAAFAY